MAAELAGTAAETWQTLFGSPAAGNSAGPGDPFGPPPGAPTGPPPGAPPGAPTSPPAGDGSGQPPGAPSGPPPRDPSGQPPGDGSGLPPGAPGASTIPGSAAVGAPPRAADSTAASTTSKRTGHYWTVHLTPPAGASAGLKAFISMAEEAIQTAVDLLGRGTPELPPKVDDLLRPVIYESIGDSLMKKQYEETLAKVQSRQTALLTYDTKVIKTSIVVAAGKDDTLRAIKAIVAELEAKLKAAGSEKLKPAKEVALMRLVAEAVDAVYEKVEAVYQLNHDMAGDGNQGSGGSGSGKGGQSGSGGGGGDGGLGQILPMLAMLPMAAMPLVSQLPELLKQHDKDKDKDKEDRADEGGKPPEGQPQAAAPGAAPPPGSPAPAPGTGQPAAPATTASAPGSATPVANVSPVSARRNVRRAVNRNGSTPTDTDAENENENENPDDEGTVVDSPVVQA